MLLWGFYRIGILPGQYWDEETGNHYNWNRYYDPTSGRYTQEDPIGFKGGINLFSYVYNRPLNDSDFNGFRPQTRTPYVRPPNNQFIEVEVRMLLNAIRQIEPDFREPPTLRSPGSGYNRNDLRYFRCYYNNIRTNNCNANGQIHHLLSREIMKALREHETLSGFFNRENPLFKYPAANRDAHNGYQTWHRNVDNEVVQWLRNKPDATLPEFTNYMASIYQRPEISMRIPSVDLGGCQ